jgi:hypothetical protein
MTDLNDLDVTQQPLARALRSQLRAAETVDAATSARLALLRQQALSAPLRLGKAWLSGIDGLAITAVLVVLAIVLPQQLPSFPSGLSHDSNNLETVEVLTEEPEPEFYQDLDMLQWLAHETDTRV